MEPHTDHSQHHAGESAPLEYVKFAIVIAGIIAGAWLYKEYSGLSFMPSFMGVFFVVFAIFKLLDLRGFVSSYIGYDLIARRSTAYAYLYPFIEIGLGVAYLSDASTPIHVTTLILMSVGAVGVAKQLLRGNHIKCACLGTYIKLPLTTVSLAEDLLMVAMALYMIIK